LPLLVDAARQVGAIQIQARGTWAGTSSRLARGRRVPVLMAYDAVVCYDRAAAGTEVPLDRFYAGYKQMKRRTDQRWWRSVIPRRRLHLPGV